MTRYFFHQIYGDTRVVDSEGEWFSSLDDARNEAIISARHFMANILLHGRPATFGVIQICDDSDRVVEEISFRYAIGL